MHGVSEAYIDGVGWVFIEPQMGCLGGRATNDVILCRADSVPSPQRIADSVLLRGRKDTAALVRDAFNTYDADGNGCVQPYMAWLHEWTLITTARSPRKS